jgi:trans-aconitate methyltransferase
MLKPEGMSALHGLPELLNAIRKETDGRPLRVVDFGIGRGSMGTHLRKHLQISFMAGVDIWEPNIEYHRTSRIYDQLILDDVANAWLRARDYDLFFFGDVLEHLPKSVAFEILNSDKAKMMAVRIPLGHYPQGASKQGNLAEVHQWSFYHKDVGLVDKNMAHGVSVCSDNLSSKRGIPKAVSVTDQKFIPDTDKRYYKAYISNLLFT